jgi:hypothetical protein
MVYGTNLEEMDDLCEAERFWLRDAERSQRLSVPVETTRRLTAASFIRCSPERWFPFAVSRPFLLLIVETVVPADASVDLVIDKTLERRWGSTISTRGHDRESTLSRRKRSLRSPGLRWIVMAGVVTLPWIMHQ